MDVDVAPSLAWRDYFRSRFFAILNSEREDNKNNLTGEGRV